MYSLTQSGFRPNRSTSDAVWAHKWLIATAQKYQIEINILGLDLSSAFDTINRKVLLAETKEVFTKDHWRMIEKLLENTTLQAKLENQLSKPFKTTIGSPQGDSLSPIIFTVYLECALRQLRPKIKRPISDKLLPPEVIYADDTDFISTSKVCLQNIKNNAPEILGKWCLKVNDGKTEETVIKRGKNEDEKWRFTKKLGTLLGDSEELKRRKQLAAAAFKQVRSLWPRRAQVSEKRRIRIYNACVKPILTYNMGTWALTQRETNELDSFHRRQLRSVIGIHYPEVISNEDLYTRTDAGPLSLDMFHARWRLLGHTLRMKNNVPAKKAMLAFFSINQETPGFRGMPRTTLPRIINTDIIEIKQAADTASSQRGPISTLIASLPDQLKSKLDLQQLEKLAKARKKWQKIVDGAHALLSRRVNAI